MGFNNYNSGFSRAPYNNNNYQGSNYSFNKDQVSTYGRSRYQNQGKKRSGSKMGVTQKGKTWISGWNVSRSKGLMSFIANATNKESVSKTGTVYQSFVCNVLYHNSGVTRTLSGFFNAPAKKLYIPELQMVASISKRYFGTVKIRK